jgi:hypothetical protein
MDPTVVIETHALIELIEKIGLLRRDMQHRKELE